MDTKQTFKEYWYSCGRQRQREIAERSGLPLNTLHCIALRGTRPIIDTVLMIDKGTDGEFSAYDWWNKAEYDWRQNANRHE